MKNNRRDFLKLAGLAGAGLAGSSLLPKNGFAAGYDSSEVSEVRREEFDMRSIIGPYGELAVSILEREVPAFSLRRGEWANIGEWRTAARARLAERLAAPEIRGVPEVTVERRFEYDGLEVEELRWQLPFGRATRATLLKPSGARGRLPAILGFHEHGAQKYFGRVKIARTADRMHPVVEDVYENYYEGYAWANEIAKRGYVVLIPDAFLFGSRRVEFEDVPGRIRQNLAFRNPDNPTDEEIREYNRWAGQHEHIMAKSLFSAGITWPGVFLAEDLKALDVLCAREDVDADRVGCGGLSGGGLRTVMAGGFDERIKCAVCIGFMTTWRDLVLHHSYTHTWMTYVPYLPRELEFTEILGLRAPLPTLVQNCNEDPLFLLSEMQRADRIMKEVYRLAGAERNYRGRFYPGGHKFDREMQLEAFDWFDRWLKG